MAMIPIQNFAGRMQADMAGHLLDDEGIPFLVKSDDIGIYGPGAEGQTVQGATLWAPEERAEEARELLRALMGQDSPGEG